jgi:hypothetical protein
MASPEGSDDTNEWFEVYAATDVDLNSLVAGRTADDLDPLFEEATDCIRLSAGQYAVFAKSADEGANGGIADVTAEFGFALVPAGSIVLGVGDVVVDQIAWTGVSDGASTALDPDQLDATANDDEANWLRCNAAYGDEKLGNTGTPGVGNEACGGGPIGDTCNDNGTDREIVSPVVGDLVITEFMSSPGGSDLTNEWFEVLALEPVDLIGLVAGRAADEMAGLVDGTDCVHVDAGEYVLFARSDVTDDNGGLPAVTAEFSFSLVPADSMFLGIGETVLDQITWTAVTDSASTALDPDQLDPDANDDEANWTACGAPYGDAELENTGSPGEANDACFTFAP